MANAKKKKNYRDSIEGMGKRELNALNKEIRAHYKEHGWRKTVSVYKVAPSDLSAIVDPDGKNKAKKKKPKATKAKAAPKKKQKKAPKKAPKKKHKWKEPKKKPGRPKKDASAPDKKSKKRRSKKKTLSPRKTKAPAAKKKAKAATDEDGMVLDWLLKKRASMSEWARKETTLEQVIVDLTAFVRGV
jgi:hypothetical protein